MMIDYCFDELIRHMYYLVSRSIMNRMPFIFLDLFLKLTANAVFQRSRFHLRNDAHHASHYSNVGKS
jgi:hypothetical protein